jgi:hypothetical protein
MKSLLLGYDALHRELLLKPEQRKTHTHVIGSSGSGKSKFLESMIRGELRNRQGFCLLDPHGNLYDDVLNYCSHHVLDRDIILLNPSSPNSVIGFNPFQRPDHGNISVLVDRRINATMHAWDRPNTDQTPTLERTLRLIYTVMLDQNLGLPQVQHLIDFNAREIRQHLIEHLSSSPIQKEWRELQAMRPREWREQTLSAKNRLFRFLTSPALMRFMGIPGQRLNLTRIMDEGKVLLVNLAPSDELSEENARVFGALLVNEFFEAARRRTSGTFGNDPKPYYLYIDEFQSFVSLDIADMLDHVRKFGLFTILAHQRFGHLDENMTDAVLTNCRIKAVFGGLPSSSARLMAEELFLGELDPRKIKVAIYQTKFWPKYSRDKVYTKSGSQSTTSGWSETSIHGTSSGNGSSEWFQPGDWFGDPVPTGRSSKSSVSGESQSWGEGISGSETHGESESVADIPILLPVPFQELSSVQYYSADEQLLELTAALKEQFQRHCFIKVQGEKTQAMLVPLVQPFYTPFANQAWYSDKLLTTHGALSAEVADALIDFQETALLQTIQQPAEPTISTVRNGAHLRGSQGLAEDRGATSIWNRAPQQQPVYRKRGPKPDTENHAKVAEIVSRYGEHWTTDDNLSEICEQLDEAGVPIPKTWAYRSDAKSRSWPRALTNYRQLVVKAIKDRLKMANGQGG